MAFRIYLCRHTELQVRCFAACENNSNRCHALNLRSNIVASQSVRNVHPLSYPNGGRHSGW